MRRGPVSIALVLALAFGLFVLLARRDASDAGRRARPATPAEIAAELGGRRAPASPSASAGALPSAPMGEPSGALDRALVDRNARALAALEAGDHERAVALLESCVSEAPDEPVLRANLAEALARLATRRREGGGSEALAEAAGLYARASELAPEREDLVRRRIEVERLAGSEAGRWVDVSEHFELVFDGERSELLWSSTELCDALERAYHELGDLFGRFPVEHGRERIRVVLYRRGEFHSVVPIGHWVAGVFDGSVRVPLEDLGRERASLERVLRHEVAHAFVRDLGGRDVPSWLDEGLAQWLEEPAADARRARVSRARDRLAGAELFPLSALRSGLAGWEDSAAVTRAYDQALWMVDGFAERFGERLPFDLVAAVGDERELEALFRERTGLSLDEAVVLLAQGGR